MFFCGALGFDFSDRVRLALGADRRTYWSNGIIPVSEFSSRRPRQLGDRAVSILPTLLLVQLERLLSPFSLCRRSCVVAASYFWHRAALSLVGLVIFYLSLAIAGQTFLSFQWDISSSSRPGFLSIFSRLGSFRPKRRTDPPIFPPRAFLLKLLLFKLTIMSGVVKLTSGDDSWWGPDRARLSLLVAAVADRDRLVGRSNPLPFKKFSGCVLSRRRINRSIFIWAPRRLRLLALWLPVFCRS